MAIGGFLGGLAGAGGVLRGANEGALLEALARQRQLQAQQAAQQAQQEQQLQQYLPQIWQAGLQAGQQPAGGQDALSGGNQYGLPPVQSQPLPPQGTAGTFPAPTMGGGQTPQPAMQPMMAPDVNWQGEQPQFREAVGSMLAAAPPTVRSSSSVTSGYRTPEQQAAAYARYQSGQGGLAAPPGQSEHQKGLAADWKFATPQADQWMHQNAGRFGLGFPLGARDPNHMQLVAQDIAKKAQAVAKMAGPEAAQDAAQGATKTFQLIDPAAYGRAHAAQLMHAIDQTMPDAPAFVKFSALGMLTKIMQPGDQQMLKLQMQQNQNLFREEFELYKRKLTAEQPPTKYEQQRLTLDREKLTFEEGKPPAGQQKPARFGSVDDLMQRWRDDYVKSHQGQEPSTDDIAKQRAAITKEAKPMSATQAGVVRRLEVGANEVAKSVDALTSLPYGTTLGLFGGAQGMMGPGLVENLKKSLANQVTPESAQVMKALSQGLGRGLAIISAGGVAQGMEELGKQLQQQVPTSGDKGLTVIGKFADMRQLFDAATEVMMADEQIPEGQKALIAQMQEKVHKAIPFETQDVALLVGKPTDERIRQFAERMGMGKGKEGSTGGGGQTTLDVTPEQYEKLPSGAAYTMPGDSTVHYKQ